MKIVKVKWLDVVTNCERDPLPHAMMAELGIWETVGFLIYEDEETIKLAHMIGDIPYAPTKTVSDYSVIPKGCIVERKEYGE